MKHIAYNIVTGEVICTNRVNHLKKLVRKHNRWNINDGYTTGKWAFVHGPNKYETIRRKLPK